MESNTLNKATISIDALASVSRISEMKEVACEEVKKSFESFCLMAGVDNVLKTFEEDAKEICGPRYGRGAGKRGQTRLLAGRGNPLVLALQHLGLP
jgi:hypothetical protein